MLQKLPISYRVREPAERRVINDTSVLSIFISSCLHLNPDSVLEFFPSSREENILFMHLLLLTRRKFFRDQIVLTSVNLSHIIQTLTESLMFLKRR